MSRYKTTLILSIILLFVGCTQKNQTVKIGKKAFANEDILIINALEAQRDKNYKKAIETLGVLYKKSGKLNYLEEENKVAVLSADTNSYNLLMSSIKKYPDNLLFKKLLIQYYVSKKQYKKAEGKILELLKIEKNARNLTLMGDVYMLEKSYKLALKYYQSSFNKDKSQKSLLNMVGILYKFLDRQIYGQEKNLDGIISTYKKLYKKYKKEEFAKKVIGLLIYKKDKNGAIKFLKNSGYNPKMLLNIYTSSNNFKEAYKVAKKLYKESGDVEFLGKMAIYQYEANIKHLNKKILNSVSRKFENTLKDFQDPVYLNYYGYLLIDHDIDVKKGIKLVKRALEVEPKSLFYLDSLAWGYYKLKRCEEAYKIMKKFAKSSDEPEVNMHFEKIKKCLKESK